MNPLVYVIFMIIFFYIAKYIHNLTQKYYIFPPKNGINRLSFDSRICRKHPRFDWHAQLTDKARVKEIIAALNIPDLHVPRTYAVLETCSDFKYDNLPNDFVIKPTHYSGIVHICKKCTDSPLMCDTKIKDTLNKSWNNRWKKMIHNFIPIVEHHYDYIVPRIIIEEYIQNNDDWKIHVYKKEILFVHLCTERVDHSSKKFAITPSYEKIPWKRFEVILTDDPLPARPPEWERMKQIAIELATKLIGDDYVRVDLYISNNMIYLGELTFTPAGGRARFEPKNAEIDILQGI